MKDNIDTYNVIRRRATKEVGEAFDRFWAAYPKRNAAAPKKPSFLIFSRLLAQGESADQIVAAAAAYAQAERKNIGTPFILQPAKWLIDEHWSAYDSSNVMSVEEFRQKMKEYEERKEREREARRRRL